MGAAFPPVGFERLLLVVTGAVPAAYTPQHAGWLRTTYPGLDVRIMLTRSAERFVTATALGVISGTEVLYDTWPEGPVTAGPHVRLAEWADAVLVCPATVGYLSRLALGLADSPSLLALYCTRAPVAVVPGFPPGAWHNPTTERHVSTLAERRNVLVVPPVPMRSWTTGQTGAHGPPPFPALIGALELHRRSLEEDR
ncbi:flavoprotein [Nonomuraea sp. NPDC050663]|uniref:flavoprotein n=1 Tax=Nonomuraea sp. NPDC050663 TaxID=3364370 RepID=UPI0037BC3328